MLAGLLILSLVSGCGVRDRAAFAAAAGRLIDLPEPSRVVANCGAARFDLQALRAILASAEPFLTKGGQPTTAQVFATFSHSRNGAIAEWDHPFSLADPLFSFDPGFIPRDVGSPILGGYRVYAVEVSDGFDTYLGFDHRAVFIQVASLGKPPRRNDNYRLWLVAHTQNDEASCR
jgi:hypothetical protein